MSQAEWLAESVLIPRDLIEDAIDALEMVAAEHSYRYGEYQASADKLRALVGSMPDPSADEQRETLRAMDTYLAEKARAGGWEYTPMVPD